MSDEANLKRLNLRMSAEDVAWLIEQAEDEGVDYTTLIRMIINRLRRGRPPLVSMMGPTQPVRRETQAIRDVNVVIPGPEDSAEIAEDVLQARLNELEGGEVVQLHADSPSETEAAAIPLRRVAREQYNPGRR